MARLPELPMDEGKHVQMQPAGGIASVDASISPAPAQNLATAGKEFDQTGIYLAKAQDDYDSLQATDALLKLKEQLQQQKNGDGGWRFQTLQKASTPEFYAEASEKMVDASKVTGDVLQSPGARMMYDRRAKQEILSYQAQLLEHQAEQSTKWKTTQFQSITTANLRLLATTDLNSYTLASNYGSYLDESIAAQERINESAFGNDEAGRKARQAAVQDVKDVYAITLLQGALDKNRPDIADAMMRGEYAPGGGNRMPALQDQLSSKALEHIQPRITAAKNDYLPTVGAQKLVDAAVASVAKQKTDATFNVMNGLKPLTTVDDIINDVIGREGGFVARDGASMAPAKYGINKRAHPTVDVENLTKDEAGKIYREEYWAAIDGNKLLLENPAYAMVAMDTAVNMGVGTAKKMLRQADGDVGKLMQLRQERYDMLAMDSAFRPSYGGWMKRQQDLMARIGAVQTGMPVGGNKDLAAMRETLLQQADKFAAENNFTPQQADALRAKTLHRLEQSVAAQNAVKAQSADQLMGMIRNNNITSFDQLKANPDALKLVENLDATGQYHIQHVLDSQLNRQSQGTHSTNPLSYQQLYFDIANGKVRNEHDLFMRIGTGQVGTQYYDFFKNVMKRRELGVDVADKEFEQHTKMIMGAWMANPVLAVNPQGKELAALGVQQWHQEVGKRIEEANKLPSEQRVKAIKDMFDPNSQTYVGVGSQTANMFMPGAEDIKAKIKGKAAMGFLPVQKAGREFDTERRLEAQKSGVILLERGKEDVQIKLVPVNGDFYAYNPASGAWEPRTRIK